MELLSDGTVLIADDTYTQPWFRLKPDATGSYVNGVWSLAPDMHDTRLYFPSQMLSDGRLFVAGGEFGNGTRTAEIFDPVAETWTRIPGRALGDIGDVPSEILPDGRVLVGYRFGPQTTIYDPVGNTWTNAAPKLRFSPSDEESWMLLPDHSVLTVETNTPPHAQKYLPADNVWVDAGTTPANLITGFEIGPGLLLPDGRAFFIGATGHTALYTPPDDPHDPGTWASGPDLPGDLGAWDTPAAVMPNGKVFLIVGHQNYGGPAFFFEYDPARNGLTAVPGPNFPGPYLCRMLALPNGQILVTGGTLGDSFRLYVYTPDGAPDRSWAPTIAAVTDNGDGSFVLTGTQLNGISEGAAYGDDAEMSSNYPIVRLTGADGRVYYARTFNWSNTGVATGDTPVSTEFSLPDGLEAGTYSLEVAANGIASDPVDFTVAPPATERMAAVADAWAGANAVRGSGTVVPVSPLPVQARTKDQWAPLAVEGRTLRSDLKVGAHSTRGSEAGMKRLNGFEREEASSALPVVKREMAIIWVSGDPT
jgi:hypothetical protein